MVGKSGQFVAQVTGFRAPLPAVFTSLSKRSNAPGLRSGGVAGDATLLSSFCSIARIMDAR